MERACAKALDDAAVTERDVLHGRIIRQHGENCFASAGIGDRVSRLGALGKQWFHACSRPIVDSYLITCPQQSCCQAGTHLSKADDANLDDLCSSPSAVRAFASRPCSVYCVMSRLVSDAIA